MVTQMDSLFGTLLAKLNALTIASDLNIIVVSDHGMAEISSERTINLADYIDMSLVNQEGSGPYSLLYGAEYTTMKNAVKTLNEELHITAYLKEDIPERFHFKNHYRIKDMLVLADEGWYIQNQAISSLSEAGTYIPKGGTHGYDNQLRSMHALFIAKGPAFKSGTISPPFENVNIYPLISHILNIDPHPDIDGDFKNIIHILNK